MEKITDTIIRPPTGTYLTSRHTQSTKASLSVDAQQNRANQVAVERKNRIRKKRLKILLTSGATLVLLAMTSSYVVKNTIDFTPETQSTPIASNQAINNKSAVDVELLYKQAEKIVDSNPNTSSVTMNQAIITLKQLGEADPPFIPANKLLVKVATTHKKLAEAAVEQNDLALAIGHFETSQLTGKSEIDLSGLITDLKFKLQTQYKDTIAKQNQINKLLSKAEIALAAKRFTSPKGSSAVDSYQAILNISPDHNQALIGLNKIATYYINNAKDLIGSNAFDKARQELNIAASINVQTETTRQLLAQLNNREQEYLESIRAQKARQDEIAREQKAHQQFTQHIEIAHQALAINPLSNARLEKAIENHNAAYKLNSRHEDVIALHQQITAIVIDATKKDIADHKFAHAKQSLQTATSLTNAPREFIDLKEKIHQDEIAIEDAHKADRQKQIRLDQLVAKATNMARSRHEDITSYGAIVSVYKEAEAIAPQDSRVASGLEKTRAESITTSRFFSVIQNPYLLDEETHPRRLYLSITSVIVILLTLYLSRAILASVRDRV